MSDLLWLTDEQMERLRPFFPGCHGKPRVDDRWMLSGTVFVNRNGLRWRDAPSAYGQFMGHDDSATTEKHYARFSPTFLRGAANALRILDPV